MNNLMKIVLGMVGALVLGLIFPQILLGVVVGFVIMWFLRPALKHLFNEDVKVKEVDSTSVKAMKTTIRNLRAEVRRLKQASTHADGDGDARRH